MRINENQRIDENLVEKGVNAVIKFVLNHIAHPD